MRAVVLLDEQQIIGDGRYCVLLKVLEVKRSRKFPGEIKVRFVMIDLLIGKPILIVDNHAPYGFHSHTRLPDCKQTREALAVSNYQEALEYFLQNIREIIREK